MAEVFTISDPTSFEGTPYEVAARAVAQVRGLVSLAGRTLADSEAMIRNAELSRNLIDTPDDARASEWEASVQGRKVALLAERLASVERELVMLGRAAGFDPGAAR